MSAPVHRVSSLRPTKTKAAKRTDSKSSRPRSSHKKPSAERESRRRQALEVYPFLEALQHVHAIPAHQSANSLAAQLTRPQRRALWHAIDHGLPLAGILARELKLAPWMIKHLQRHWPEFHDHDRRYGHRGWDIGALLASWTPETAPRTTRELKRLSSLTGFDHYEVLPFFQSTQAPLSSRDRQLLCQLLRDEAPYRRFQRYMAFLNMLSAWIEEHTGDPIAAPLQQMLGVTTVADWWTLCDRWHRINEELRQSLAITMNWARPSGPVIHFGLFDKPITIGEYTFTSLNNRLALKSEAERMNNCVGAYLQSQRRTNPSRCGLVWREVAPERVDSGEASRARVRSFHERRHVVYCGAGSVSQPAGRAEARHDRSGQPARNAGAVFILV